MAFREVRPVDGGQPCCVGTRFITSGKVTACRREGLVGGLSIGTELKFAPTQDGLLWDAPLSIHQSLFLVGGRCRRQHRIPMVLHRTGRPVRPCQVRLHLRKTNPAAKRTKLKRPKRQAISKLDSQYQESSWTVNFVYIISPKSGTRSLHFTNRAGANGLPEARSGNVIPDPDSPENTFKEELLGVGSPMPAGISPTQHSGLENGPRPGIYAV